MIETWHADSQRCTLLEEADVCMLPCCHQSVMLYVQPDHFRSLHMSASVLMPEPASMPVNQDKCQYDMHAAAPLHCAMIDWA